MMQILDATAGGDDDDAVITIGGEPWLFNTMLKHRGI